jgi:hypothetical protein
MYSAEIDKGAETMQILSLTELVACSASLTKKWLTTLWPGVLRPGLSVTYRRKFAAAIVFSWCLGIPCLVSAAELKQETLKAWDEYIQETNTRTQDRLQSGSFLWVDESTERRQQVRTGKIVVWPATMQTPKPVPGGLIHDWIGAAFIPNATLDDVFTVVRDYDNYKAYYKPSVADSKWLGSAGERDKFSMLLVNQQLVGKMALDTEYQSCYQQVSTSRWYSSALTTRVQEIRNFGRDDEQELGEGEGAGYVWRIYSFSRFEERDGGVYVEVEAIALSRDIPAAARWFVNPIVRRVSKNSLLISLRQTEEAVRSASTVENRVSRALGSPMDSCSAALAVKR